MLIHTFLPLITNICDILPSFSIYIHFVFVGNKCKHTRTHTHKLGDLIGFRISHVSHWLVLTDLSSTPRLCLTSPWPHSFFSFVVYKTMCFTSQAEESNEIKPVSQKYAPSFTEHSDEIWQVFCPISIISLPAEQAGVHSQKLSYCIEKQQLDSPGGI